MQLQAMCNAYVHAFIFGFGILGNLISFVVFSRKRFKFTIFHIYFRLFVITDSIVLFQALNMTIGYSSDIWIDDLFSIVCILDEYIYYVACPISAHILVVFTIDRYLSVKNPDQFACRTKKHFQLAICAAIVVYNQVA